MSRPGGPQDVPFMRDMLLHAYYWRVDRVSSSGEPPVRRYVERWGRPGDTALIAIQDFQRVGAAWYRLFTEGEPGFGFVTLTRVQVSPDLQQDGRVSLRRIGQVVHLRGGLTRRNTPAGHGTLIMTLQPEYRPRWMHHWPGNTFSGHAIGSHQFLDLSLATNGELNMWTDNNVPVPVGETIYVNTTYFLG